MCVIVLKKWDVLEETSRKCINLVEIFKHVKEKKMRVKKREKKRSKRMKKGKGEMHPDQYIMCNTAKSQNAENTTVSTPVYYDIDTLETGNTPHRFYPGE